jgi:hypothetical protein
VPKCFLLLLALFVAAPASAAPELDGRTILARATETAGGDVWANARTLVLKGHAVFWGKSGAAPSSALDSYVMHRELDPNRQAAHGAEGKLRIEGSDKGKRLWVVGYDGLNTWNDKGRDPQSRRRRLLGQQLRVRNHSPRDETGFQIRKAGR